MPKYRNSSTKRCQPRRSWRLAAVSRWVSSAASMASDSNGFSRKKQWGRTFARPAPSSAGRRYQSAAGKSRLLQFDFDINASWQVQLHQCVNGLVGWVDDVHQALVGTDFELVARGFVDVRRTQNVETLDAGWQWNWAFDNSAGALSGLNDFQGRLVDQFVIESLQADTDFLVWCGHDNSLKERTGNFVAPAILKRTKFHTTGPIWYHTLSAQFQSNLIIRPGFLQQRRRRRYGRLRG